MPKTPPKSYKSTYAYLIATILMLIFLIFLSISDFELSSIGSNVIEYRLPGQYLTGTDSTCLAAAIKLERLTRSGSVVKLTNDESWYPFQDQTVITHRYVSLILAADAAY